MFLLYTYNTSYTYLLIESRAFPESLRSWTYTALYFKVAARSHKTINIGHIWCEHGQFGRNWQYVFVLNCAGTYNKLHTQFACVSVVAVLCRNIFADPFRQAVLNDICI